MRSSRRATRPARSCSPSKSGCRTVARRRDLDHPVLCFISGWSPLGPEFPGRRRHPFVHVLHEGLHLGRQVPAARIHHLDSRGRSAPTGKEALQPASAQILRALELGKKRDAQTSGRHCVKDVHVGDDEARGHGDLHGRASAGGEQPDVAAWHLGRVGPQRPIPISRSSDWRPVQEIATPMHTVMNAESWSRTVIPVDPIRLPSRCAYR